MLDNLIISELPVARILRVVALTTLSGLADAQGFVRSARAFQDGSIVTTDIAQVVVLFSLSLISYLLAVRELMRLGIDAPEIHMLFWFAVTIVGLALLSGRMSGWQGVDRLVAGGIVLGVAWLILRVE